VTQDVVRVTPDWLALREPADAAARSRELVDRVQTRLPSDSMTVVHDLGCGSGSMGRWLAPMLTGPQHWVMYDRDADLLRLAGVDMPSVASGGSPITVETRERDITRLDIDDLTGASLITASALLDMFTAEEVERFVATCVGAGCPVLLTLSVVGRVDITPPDPLDTRIADAFNGHQRRTTGGRRLLGPDAAATTVSEFRRLGADVVVKSSPWRLGADDAALTAEWLVGWVGAAVEQQPALGDEADAYLARRLAEAQAGRLEVDVQHDDLLAWPR
jgi:hypothetical protein